MTHEEKIQELQRQWSLITEYAERYAATKRSHGAKAPQKTSLEEGGQSATEGQSVVGGQ